MKPLLDGVYTRPFITYKSNIVEYTYLSGSSDVRIDEATALEQSTFNTNTAAKTPAGIYTDLLGSSIRHLFFTSGSRMFPTNALTSESIALPCYVLSIPQNVYGEKVREHSLEIYNSSSPLSFVDDGQSRLIVSGTNIQVGYVSYAFGIAVIQRSINLDSGSLLLSSASYYAKEYFPQTYFGTYFQAADSASVISPASASLIALNFDGLFLTTGSTVNIAFNSKHTIYEKTAVCSIEPQEFNFSSNISLASSTLSGSIVGSTFIPSTGSTAGQLMLDGVLPPYMTTVGLYNDAQELLAIAKFPRPLQRSVDTQQSIIVRFDI